MTLLSREYKYCLSHYYSDIFISTIIYVTTALAAGKVWRFPFEDEVTTIIPNVGQNSILGLFSFYLAGGDVHPPTIFALFSTLYDIGFSQAAPRLCSVACTASSLAMVQSITLMLLWRRAGNIGTLTRWVAITLFGLSPLALSQGDAIRWYPLFALCVAVFLTLYTARAGKGAKLASAIPLGTALSINLIAPLVVIPFMIYRYLLERQWGFLF